MPRGARSKPGQSSSSASSGDCWLQAAEAENTLRRLCGQWRDQMGSKYQLCLDREGVLELRTTRPRGKTMRTRGLIRIEWSGDYGRVVWGRPGARMVFTIGKLDDTSMVWQSGSSKPFNWDRVEEAGEEEDVEEGKEGKDQAEGAWADGAWSTRKWSDEKWSTDGWADCDRDWDGWRESEDAVNADSKQLEANSHPWRKDGWHESEHAGRTDHKQLEAQSHPWRKERAISDPAVITEALRSIIGISGGCKNEQADVDTPEVPRWGPRK